MRRLIALWLLLLASPSFAADNAVIITPGSTTTMRSIDIGAGVQAMGHVIVGATGAAIYGTAGTANANVLSVQGISSMTPLIVTGSGTAGTAAAGVVTVQGIASMTPLLASVSAGGNTATVKAASTAPAATDPALVVSLSPNSAGLGVDNPCFSVAKTYTPISITTNTTTRIIAPTSAKKTYICSFSIQTNAANNVGIVEGTGGTCGSSTAGVYGGTTAASGLIFSANQGIAFGNGGYPVMATAGTNVDFCLITSVATNLSGHVTWVAQ